MSVTLISASSSTVGLSAFKELNDPVMGGRSTGTFEVDESGKFGIFDGSVVDVPSLSAPGFIKASADGSFDDASVAVDGDLVLNVRTTTPDYAGYRVSVVSGATSPSYACSGGGTLPFSRGCYKAPFSAATATGDDFVQIRVPFSAFSDIWSPATGEIITTCEEDSAACLSDASKLAGIQRIEIWAEGVAGDQHLEIESVSAEAPAALKIATDDENYFCSGPVQDNLRFNISSRAAEGLTVAVDDDESLAEAVCCDTRMIPYAEPLYTFIAPDIDMFSYLNESEVTVFYDSVCGIPLFQAPVGRSFDDFMEDTLEHGWPSFRAEEVFMENIVTDPNGEYVFSTCGTHLGSYLPDEKGDRWCIDVSCVAGNEM